MDSAKFGDRYEILHLLGKGGMGEVYQAHDRKLRRDVAIKTLPDGFAEDPDRVRFFLREAQVIASLNHPNIAAIHELEESVTGRFLVLELVPGETLEERLRRGPVPLKEAVSLARQICEALEAAHEKGIIHRDLKPSNIKITPDGKVKLLDFGLASAFETNPVFLDLANSPTVPAGTVIPTHCGTAAYMSPEQFQWKTINKQVDIWSFGCVFFQLLTGTMPFAAPTMRETATLVLESEPDWSLLSHIPPQLLRLIRGSLEKDRRNRLHDIGDARVALDTLSSVGSSAAFASIAQPHKLVPLWTAALLAFLLLVSGIFVSSLVWNSGRSDSGPQPVRFSIPVLQTNSITQMAVSPNGRRIAYVTTNERGTRLIWVRDLDASEPRSFPDTDDPSGIFWSADNKQVAYFSHEELKVVDSADGKTRTLSAAPGATSGTWNGRGDILIDGPEGSGLFRVSLRDGSRNQLTFPDTDKGERHFQPQFLPDEEHFLFLKKTDSRETSGIYLGHLGSQQAKLIVNASSKAMFSEPSHLFFVRDGTLFAQEVQIEKLKTIGEPIRVATHVSASAIMGSSAFSVSQNGVIAYRSGSSSQNGNVQWFSRRGEALDKIGDPAIYTQVAISPDEKHIAIEQRDGDTGAYDIWLGDPMRNTTTRLTLEPSSERNPVWLPDSRHLIFSSDRVGVWALFEMDILSANKAELVLKGTETYRATDVTRDNVLLFRNETGTFYTLALGTRQSPQTFLQTIFIKGGGRLSPDGKWLAYSSDESGQHEVYLIAFPKGDLRRKISINGGVQPIWNAKGTELFYLDFQGRVMSVAIRNGPVESGIPVPLFKTDTIPVYGLSQYTVNGSGTKFLTIAPVTDIEPTPIDVVVNWNPAR